MHECAHKLVFRRRWANEFLGGAVLAPLVLTNFAGYRKRHWDHHHRLGKPDDPKVVYHTDITALRLLALLARCLVGVEAWRRLTELSDDSHAHDLEVWHGKGGLSVGLLVTQISFAGSIVVVAIAAHGGDWRAAVLAAACAYVGVYAYSLASLTVFAAALRAIAEHQIGGDDAVTQDAAALRNLRCNPMTRLVFGAYGFGEHATHHRRPGVPYYRLPDLTRVLAARDAALVPRVGYLGMIALLVSVRPAKPAPPTDVALDR